MSLRRQQLVSNYVSAIHETDAALFIGAGMSRQNGFVDWKGLLRDCALELNLDIDREHDLVAVAQYYLNHRMMDRSRLNQILKNEFGKPGTFSDNHEIIGRLPIQTVWTTNFDSLLEKAFLKAGKNVEVKVVDQDLAMHTKGREVLIYKMHGDVAKPSEVIICKDDYERYADTHPLIQNQLEADLINKTFLFLGFSFTDPHLDYMLGHLRTLLKGNKREHYAIMRRARLKYEHGKKKEEAQRTFEYETNKQALQIQDLQRYSIHTHLIDKYEEITQILETIEQYYYRRNVLVSGSAHEFGTFGEERMRNLCVQLGERLMEKECKLISGFGLNIGDSTVHGAVLKLYATGKSVLEKHLLLRPFPRNLPGLDEEEFNRKYREDMIANCGFAVFIGGTSRTHSESRGVLQEYELVRKLKKIPIPIGATGFAAQRIWEIIEPEVKTLYQNKITAQLFQRLNDSKLNNEQLLDVVFEIIDRVSPI